MIYTVQTKEKCGKMVIMSPIFLIVVIFFNYYRYDISSKAQFALFSHTTDMTSLMGLTLLNSLLAQQYFSMRSVQCSYRVSIPSYLVRTASNLRHQSGVGTTRVEFGDLDTMDKISPTSSAWSE